MSRLLGIDHGTKRVGVALSDAERRIASPLATLDVSKDEQRVLRQIAELAVEWGAAEFVVGLPLNMDGSEGPQAKAAREFGRLLERVAGRPVQFWDERLTSHSAVEAMGEADLTRGQMKGRVDRVAAAIMLQSYLDAHSAGMGVTEP
ncbi:MAG: Holliday junction resolvase RuvX [Phycisphaerales bacterium]|nr:Holliday junction resolvase RuvX [Phycisphaerales bacterium]